MRDAQDSDAWTDSPPGAPRRLASLPASRRLFDGLSWRLAGLTIVAVSALCRMGSPAKFGDAGRRLQATLDSVLEGLCVLLFAIVLSNLRNRALPRPLALGLAVLLGSVVGNAIIELSVGLGIVERIRPDTGWHLGNVLWGARRAAFTWAFLVAAWYFVERIAERTAQLHEAELARHQLDARIVEARLQVMQAQTEPHSCSTRSHVGGCAGPIPPRRRCSTASAITCVNAAADARRGATLGRESTSRAYLDVQKIRMGTPRGRRRRAIALFMPFPSMMLLTLVEMPSAWTEPAAGRRHTISATLAARSVTVADSG
jgi:hypothetical protein